MIVDALEQGGFVFLETTAVVNIFLCFASYASYITELLVMSSSLKNIVQTEHSWNMARLDGLSNEDYVQGTLNTSQQIRWAEFEAFTIGISQFSIVIVAEDESSMLFIISLLYLTIIKKYSNIQFPMQVKFENLCLRLTSV